MKKPVLLLLAALAFSGHAVAEESPMPSAPTEKATLAGGCFWCIEAVFERIPGVRRATSGYTGGQTPNPTYRQVCSGNTGHAEAVEIEFDPANISFGQLLDIFWQAHDPTQLNRQGNDVGTQYRSAIFYHSEAQKQAAESAIQALNASGQYKKPIVTQVAPATTFYTAEDYHQGYFDQNRNQPYCRFVIQPKLSKMGLEEK